MATSVGWQQLLETHPLAPDSDQAEFWAGYLDEHPDVLYRLLADLHQAVHGADRPPTLDELWEVMSTPQFSTEPFGDAVRTALGQRSIRWLAQQIGLHQSALNRAVTGEKDIVSIRDPLGSMRRIEAVAKALRVHPSYFMEWRRLWIMALLDGAFSTQPDLSIGVYRRFSRFDQKRGHPLLNGR